MIWEIKSIITYYPMEAQIRKVQLLQDLGVDGYYLGLLVIHIRKINE